MTTRHALTRRVLFHETDMAGVVHFSCYFKYMEEAEHALWREAGLTIARRGGEIGWPRVAASFDYKRALHYDEQFEVAVRIVAMTPRTIRYACTITRAGEPVASGSMTIACVTQQGNEPMRSAPIPAEVAERLGVDAAVEV